MQKAYANNALNPDRFLNGAQCIPELTRVRTLLHLSLQTLECGMFQNRTFHGGTVTGIIGRILKRACEAGDQAVHALDCRAQSDFVAPRPIAALVLDLHLKTECLSGKGEIDRRGMTATKYLRRASCRHRDSRCSPSLFVT